MPVQKDWLHCNGIDYNQALDQIAINSVRGEFYVIDHGNTFIAGNPSNSIALTTTAAGDFRLVSRNCGSIPALEVGLTCDTRLLP